MFTEDGTPPLPGAAEHHWAAAVGANVAADPATRRRPAPASAARSRTPAGDLPGLGPNAPAQPDRCDDTAYGKGAGGECSYHVVVPAGGERRSGSASPARRPDGPAAGDAQRRCEGILADPAGALTAKTAARDALAAHTKLDLPGDPQLAAGHRLEQAEPRRRGPGGSGLQVRETNAGTRTRRRSAPSTSAGWIAAGFPDYPWMFSTDGEYTAFASVAARPVRRDRGPPPRACAT